MAVTRRGTLLAVGAAAGIGMAGTAAAEGRLVTNELASRFVPGAVKVSVLTPPGETRDLPLLLLLHGGDGDNGFLARMRPDIEAAWADGDLPPVAVATPDARRSFYMDYRDGSQKWESFIVSDLIPHLRSAHALSSARSRTALAGISMGGLGALRLGFKHPDLFGGLAALEAGIEPALRFEDVKVRNAFQRGPRLLQTIFGEPIDTAYWAANNPANLAITQREAIVGAGLQVYIEVGDLDMFHLDEGVEFLHRVMWDHRIAHEYRLVRGADHVGSTLGPRLRDALRFLTRQVLDPAPPDHSGAAAKGVVQALKRAAGVDDTAPRPPLPGTDP